MPTVSIFKAYDIRGVVPGELTAADAYGIGRATARFLGAAALAVGRDARSHSPELAAALMRGITDEGVDVIDLSLIATPMLYFAVEHLNLGGGVMVTASHNPGRYNGFKICRERAIPVGGETGLQEIEALVPKRVPAAAVTPAGSVQARSLLREYIAHVRSAATGPMPALVVAIDCGNGMAGVALEALLPELPLKVERLYFEPDGTFPNHEADPLKRENLADLIAAVRRSRAALGVAFDGDADRAVFVDETGEPVSSDLVTALLARPRLRAAPGARVLFDLRSSRATAEEIRAAGGVPEMCRVGHSFIKARMRESGAIFAGELSGHFYFRFSERLIADDGIAAFVALLSVLGQEKKPFSQLVAPLRRYTASGEINRRAQKIPELLDAIEAEHRGAADVSRLDGLLVSYPDWWFNLRPSNTEPVLRLNLEAATAADMRRHCDELLARIERGA